MSQTPHPHDPYGTEPGTPASEPGNTAASTPGSEQQPVEQGAATSDPALHPHDPYAYDADAADSSLLDVDSPATGSPQAASGAQPSQQAPYAPQDQHAPQDQQAQHAQQAPYAQSTQQGPHAGYAQSSQQGHYGAAPAGEGAALPPAGTRGVYEGPLTGDPVSGSDSRLWATIAQAAVAVGHVVSWGFLGWVGPLVVFLMYKDRDRYVRFHSAEALNGAIAVFLAQIVLTIAITIMAVVTFGIGTILYPLVGLPALLQLIFSIIGAIKANRGEYWSYPFNIRLVK